MEEEFFGGGVLWRRISLQEEFFGGGVLWRRSYLEEEFFGGEIPWYGGNGAFLGRGSFSITWGGGGSMFSFGGSCVP